MESNETKRPASDLGAYDPKWVTLSEQSSAGIARRQVRAEAILARDRAMTDEQRKAAADKRDHAPLAQYMNDTKPFSIWAS